MLQELQQLSQKFLTDKNQSYRRYFLQSPHFETPLSILLGQRGVGKTTLLIQYLLEQVSNDIFSSEILYVQSDHFSMGDTALYEIAENFSNMGGRYLVFDEIHKYQDWSKELKSIYDSFPQLKVIASGSSALEIYKGSHDLSRRGIVHRIQGMSFREFLEFELGITFGSYAFQDLLVKHQEICREITRKISKQGRKILPLFKSYLRIGYYPYYKTLKENLYFMTLEQNIHTTIESDLTAIYPHLNGNSIKKIEQLMRFIASAVPFTPSWNNLKSILGVGDIRTLKNYFKYLEDAGLIQTLSSASSKLRKLEQPEKIYLNNTNQSVAISSPKINMGTLRETFFLSMVSPLHSVTSPEVGDFMVDSNFIIEVGGKKKSKKQIYDNSAAYLACDDIDMGIDHKIPLWLFGFLY